MILNCAGAICTLTQADDIASGAVNTFIADFTFDSNWDGLTRTAVFNNGYQTKAVLLVADSCTIPWEVMSDPGELRIGCVGVTDSTTILTTNMLKVGRIVIGADTAADPSTTPTPDVYNQIVSLLAEKVAYIDIVDDLTTGGSAVPLSAEQGKVLQDGLQFQATNVVSNGDFSSGTTGWIHFGTYSIESVVDGWLRSTRDTNRPFPGTDSSWGIITTHKIYVSFDARANKQGTVTVKGYKTGIALDSVMGFFSPTFDIFPQKLSHIFTATDIVNGIYFSGDGFAISGDYIELDNVIGIDLTAAFGAGNEPSLTEMDAIMALYGNSWFDGVTDIQFVDQIIARLQTKADIVQEDWIEPTLLNSWVNFGSPYFNVGYYKNSIEKVNIVATIKNGTVTTGTNIFSLAAGYRPANDQYFVCASNGIFGLIVVRADGDVEIQTANSTYLSLDGISFRAEA